MIKKFSAIFGLALVAIFAYASSAYAAADAVLTSAFASSTALVTDNYSAIALFIVGLGLLTFVIAISKRAIIMAIKWVLGAFSGRKGRRR